MNTVQVLLLITLVISTIFLSVIGMQLMLLLRQANKALTRVNKIIDGFDTLGTGLQQGLGEVSGFINGIKTILKIIDITHKNKNETKN